MLLGLIRAYRRLYWALLRYYCRRARQLPPEQEAARDVARMRREQEALRRLMWRR